MNPPTEPQPPDLCPHHLPLTQSLSHAGSAGCCSSVLVALWGKPTPSCLGLAGLVCTPKPQFWQQCCGAEPSTGRGGSRSQAQPLQWGSHPHLCQVTAAPPGLSWGAHTSTGKQLLDGSAIPTEFGMSSVLTHWQMDGNCLVGSAATGLSCASDTAPWAIPVPKIVAHPCRVAQEEGSSSPRKAQLQGSPSCPSQIPRNCPYHSVSCARGWQCPT